MKKFFFALVGVAVFSRAAKAQVVTISVDAGALQSAAGVSAEPVGGLLQLIASPSNTFSAPTSASYTSGDNVVISNFAMNNSGGTAETFNTLTSIPLSTTNYTLMIGEALELRFYPTLTLASMPTSPGLTTTYGQVRSSSIEFGTAGGVPAETAWIVPSSGSTVNFEYVTVSNGGTSAYTNASAYANNVVTAVPEPSTMVMLAAGGLSVAGTFLRRRRLK